MRIGVPREVRPGETMVAATPKTVTQLIGLGYEVLVEQGAGEEAHFHDAAYAGAGADIETVEEVWKADVILKVYQPMDGEFDRLRRGQIIISMMAPARNDELIRLLAKHGATGLALDAVPRISRAQALDVLSSQANVAGYRAVIESAHAYGALLNGQVTAAGKVPPATVFVIGAGVAGLAAIGTAGSLGAIVKGTDVRPEAAEQVESMGGEFVHLDDDAAEVSSDGYAKEMSGDQQERAMALYARESASADIVITTALIPGKPAPTLITREMVAEMKPGSVIMDMAAANGGNCELTVKDERIVTPNGVIILGYTDLAGRLPTQSSQLFGTNVVNLMKLLTPNKDGQVVLDFDDVVQRNMTVVRDGEVTWPPPPVNVSAAPVPAAASATLPEVSPDHAKDLATRRRSRNNALMGIAAVAFLLLATFAPTAFLGHITVFVLAVVVGYYVISNVTHALHTPLMTETNAISGIILVGALLQIGSDNLAVTIIAFIAVTVASINIFGGFLVANRMLNMFKKG